MTTLATTAANICRQGYKALLVLTDWASYLTLVSMVLVICVDVACRYFLGFSTQIAEEVASLGLVALMFVSLAGAFEDGKFLRVDALYEILPKPVRRVLDALFHLIGLAVTATYVVYLAALVVNSFQKNIRSGTALGTPNYLTQSAMVMGLCVLLVALTFGLGRILVGGKTERHSDD